MGNCTDIANLCIKLVLSNTFKQHASKHRQNSFLVFRKIIAMFRAKLYDLSFGLLERLRYDPKKFKPVQHNMFFQKEN